MVALTIGLLIGVIMLGLTFNTFLFNRTHAQFQMDARAMAIASKFNAGDRIGQMNEVVEASRELVCDSRDQLEECNKQELREFGGLYAQLADEARLGQSAVEAERSNLIRIINRDVQQEVLASNAAIASTRPFGLPWLNASEPIIDCAEIGSIDKVASSVYSPGGLADLAESDRTKKLVDSRSGLFVGNCNARLSTTDGDLDFKLSSLPACVGGAAAPARNVSPDVFKPLAVVVSAGAAVPKLPDQIPSAVRLTCLVNTQLGQKRETGAVIKLVAAACAHGAIAGGAEVDPADSSHP